MARKKQASRKSRQRTSQRRMQRAPQTQTARVTQRQGDKEGISEPSRGAEADFAEEYRYIVSDLKRFGLTAIAMFALLIVLALVI